MKKLNNKGFMLIEVIIVSTVIITTLTGLYVGFSNTYKEYETQSNYYDSKTIYALKNMENFLIDEMLLNSLATKPINYFNEINAGFVANQYQKTYITTFKNDYGIEKLYIAKFTKQALNNLKNSSSLNLDFKNFIKNIIDDNEDNFTSSNYSYILIANTKEEKYSYLRIK